MKLRSWNAKELSEARNISEAEAYEVSRSMKKQGYADSRMRTSFGAGQPETEFYLTDAGIEKGSEVVRRFRLTVMKILDYDSLESWEEIYGVSFEKPAKPYDLNQKQILQVLKS